MALNYQGEEKMPEIKGIIVRFAEVGDVAISQVEHHSGYSHILRNISPEISCTECGRSIHWPADSEAQTHFYHCFLAAYVCWLCFFKLNLLWYEILVYFPFFMSFNIWNFKSKKLEISCSIFSAPCWTLLDRAGLRAVEKVVRLCVPSVHISVNSPRHVYIYTCIYI